MGTGCRSTNETNLTRSRRRHGEPCGGVKRIDAVGSRDETPLDFSIYDAKQSGYGKVVHIIRKDIEKDFRKRIFDRVARNMEASSVFQTPEAFLTEKENRLIDARVIELVEKI
jgi:hypothetical protein